jgi:hypothetical protein
MVAGLEGAFVLSRALRSTEPVELAGEAAVAAIETALAEQRQPARAPLSGRSTAGTG